MGLNFLLNSEDNLFFQVSKSKDNDLVFVQFKACWVCDILESLKHVEHGILIARSVDEECEISDLRNPEIRAMFLTASPARS